MCHRPVSTTTLWSTLSLLDRRAADEVRRRGCARGACGGALHVANYARKPRGVARAALGDAWRLRLSFCCARCRRRTTPPSVRFLGRKVYVGALLVLFGNRIVSATPGASAFGSVSLASGIPVRTLERWHAWWTGVVPSTRWWTTLSARFVPGIDTMTLPAALLARVEAVGVEARLTAVLGLTRPLSTRTCSHCPMLDASTHEMA